MRLFFPLLLLLSTACPEREPDTDDGTDTTTETDTESDSDTDTESETETDTDTETETETDTDCIPEPAHTTRFDAITLLKADGAPPQITHIQVVDLFETGGPELLVSDLGRSTVEWLGNCDVDGCEVRALDAPWNQPTRSEVADIDGDGLNDVVIADIGSLGPVPAPEDMVGVLRVLTQNDAGGFTHEELLWDIGRLVCARPADFDGDGDLDLALCIFGNEFGELAWYEQDFSGWTKHTLIDQPGVIDAWPVDIDEDGDLDIVANISQLEEAVVVLYNQGDATFLGQQIFKAPVDYFGMAGIKLSDLDDDGDLDVVLTNGDSLDADLPLEVHPADNYGVKWLENHDDGTWTTHEIIRHWGAYSSSAVDMDQDCDMDIVVSAFQDPWVFAELTGHDFKDRPLQRDPLFWLENDGSQGFTKHTIAVPGVPHLFTSAVVDLDGDGADDVISGPLDPLPSGRADRVIWYRAIWE